MATSFPAQGYLGWGKGMPYAPGFMILGQEDGRVVTALYHEGSDGKSYSIVYINLDLNVRNNRGTEEIVIVTTNQSLSRSE